jgi:hypothetical protein
VTIIRRLYPMKISAQTSPRVIRARQQPPPDVLEERGYEIKDFARAARYRSTWC